MNYNESPLYSPPRSEDCMAIGIGFGAFIMILLLLLAYVLWG